jgi:predicted PurR-regulated permease PerM
VSGDSDGPVPPSPIDLSARARGALTDAAIWLGIAAALFLAWKVASSLLLILAGLVFAAGLQGGERLLGRVWHVRGGVRLSVVIALFVVAVLGFLYFAGTQIAEEAGQLQATLVTQSERLSILAKEYGLGGGGGDPVAALKEQIGSSLGRILTVIGGAAGVVGSILLIVVFGIFVAADPRLYERGIEWLTPGPRRAGTQATIEAMAAMLRRWVGGRLVLMLFEGTLIFIGLSVVGTPLALLLALVAGLFAFIPNLGAIASGALMIAVGFSAGSTVGLETLGVYLAVQCADQFVSPLIEKRAVDLAPAIVLAAQLIFGVLFGIMGLILADPIVALVKVALASRETPAR